MVLVDLIQPPSKAWHWAPSSLFFYAGSIGEAQFAADFRVDFFHLFYFQLELKASLLLCLELLFQFAYVRL